MTENGIIWICANITPDSVDLNVLSTLELTGDFGAWLLS